MIMLTECQNGWDAVNGLLRGKFIALNTELGKSKVEKSMMWTSIPENQKKRNKRKGRRIKNPIPGKSFYFKSHIWEPANLQV